MTDHVGGAYVTRACAMIFRIRNRIHAYAKGDCRMSKLYVGNVPEGAKEEEIKEMFEAFGSVEEVALLRGYGFVVRMRECALFRSYMRSCLFSRPF